MAFQDIVGSASIKPSTLSSGKHEVTREDGTPITFTMENDHTKGPAPGAVTSTLSQLTYGNNSPESPR